MAYLVWSTAKVRNQPKHLRPQVWSVLSSITFRRCLEELRIFVYPADFLYSIYNTGQDNSRDDALIYNVNISEADYHRLGFAKYDNIAKPAKTLYKLILCCLSRKSVRLVLLPVSPLPLCVDLSAEFTSPYSTTDYPLSMCLIREWKRPRNYLRWFKRKDRQPWKPIHYHTHSASIAIWGVSSDSTRTFAIPSWIPSSHAIASDRRIKNHHAQSSITLNIPAPFSTHFKDLLYNAKVVRDFRSHMFEYSSTSPDPCRDLGYELQSLNRYKKKVQDWINGDQADRRELGEEEQTLARSSVRRLLQRQHTFPDGPPYETGASSSSDSTGLCDESWLMEESYKTAGLDWSCIPSVSSMHLRYLEILILRSVMMDAECIYPDTRQECPASQTAWIEHDLKRHTHRPSFAPMEGGTASSHSHNASYQHSRKRTPLHHSPSSRQRIQRGRLSLSCVRCHEAGPRRKLSVSSSRSPDHLVSSILLVWDRQRRQNEDAVSEVKTMIIGRLRSLFNECPNKSIIDYSNIDRNHKWLAILDNPQIVEKDRGPREF